MREEAEFEVVSGCVEGFVLKTTCMYDCVEDWPLGRFDWKSCMFACFVFI